MAERGGKALHTIDEIRAQNQHFESEIPDFFIIINEDDNHDDYYDDDEIIMKSFSSKGRHCCCFGSQSKPGRALLGSSSSSSSPHDWEKIQSTAEIRKNGWWARALRRIRQIVAVPKMKTLLCRFRRNSGGCGGGAGKSGRGSGKFQYDPSSYYLNFDEGQGQNGHFRDEYGYFPNFSSRFAYIPHQVYTKSPPTDMAKFGISSAA